MQVKDVAGGRACTAPSIEPAAVPNTVQSGRVPMRRLCDETLTKVPSVSRQLPAKTSSAAGLSIMQVTSTTG